jgi:peptide/nickel transport system ATP-binding protein
VCALERPEDVRRGRGGVGRQVLDDVGLDPDVAADRRPHQFSGGQCQRICIARALVLDPKMTICDEPVSALDVSVHAQVLNLLEELKHRYGLTMIFIAHDLAVVKNVSDRVAVMYLGKVCEVAGCDALYQDPAHPYTVALLKSIPVPDPRIRPDPEDRIEGELPSPLFPPSGCRFRTHCPLAQERCAAEDRNFVTLMAATMYPVSFPSATMRHHQSHRRPTGTAPGPDQPGGVRLHRQGGTNVGAVTGNELSQG